MRIVTTLAATGMIVAGMTLGVGLAGPANATISVIGSEGDYNPYYFRDELRYAGITHEDVANASELGPRICRQRAEGWTSGQLEDSLMSNDYTSEQAVVIVRGAEFHFCPQFDGDPV